jgi:hypothetical protein
MKTYLDKTGRAINVGDILKYQETLDNDEEYGKSLDEVVMHNGELHGVPRIGLPRWTQIHGAEPISLVYYAGTWNQSGAIDCVEIIGNVADAPQFLTPKHAHKVWR